MRCRGCAFDAWTAYWVGQPRDLFRDRQPPGIGAKSGVTGISRIHEMPAKRLRNAVMRIRPRPPFPHSRRPAVVLALAGMVYQGLRIEPSVRAWPRVPSTHGGAATAQPRPRKEPVSFNRTAGSPTAVGPAKPFFLATAVSGVVQRKKWKNCRRSYASLLLVRSSLTPGPADFGGLHSSSSLQNPWLTKIKHKWLFS